MDQVQIVEVPEVKNECMFGSFGMNPHHLETPALPVSRRSSRICAFLAIAGGLITLAGWLLDIPHLTDWLGSGISMMPNTAIAISIAGAALLALSHSSFHLARAFAAIFGSIGALTMIEHLLTIDLGIDELILQADWGQHATTSPGRMGVPASVMFTILGISVWLATMGSTARQLASMGATACIVICSISLTGFIYGAAGFYEIPEWTAISMTTALLFTFLGVGLIASLPDVEPMLTIRARTATGALVRRALPFLIAIPLLIGWLRIVSDQMGWFDVAYGITLRTIVEMILLVMLLAWMARAVNLHERSLRKSEAALRNSEQRYHAFIQHSSEGIWRCEIKPMDISLPPEEQVEWFYRYGVLAECNDAMARMYGLTSGDELSGARMEELLPRTPGNLAYLREIVASGYHLRNGETEENDMSGARLHFSNNVVGIFEDGLLVRAWGTQQNITERKKAEMALREADQRKDEFLATLAHELRNPLSPLVSGLDIMTSDDKALSSGETKGIHEMMRRQLHHMVRLIDDLMDINRINRGKIELRLEPLELAGVLDAAIESSRPLMDRRGHRVEVSIPTESLSVHGDAVRLAQVFQNVLNNAAHYTPPGGLIRVEATQDGPDVLIRVTDNGIGLEKEDLESIFEMFGQVDRTSKRENSGLGIGLALVKHLVEDHGGTVNATSDGPGRGTTMHIRLPLMKYGTGSGKNGSAMERHPAHSGKSGKA